MDGGEKMDKSLSMKERLILANQYEILSRLATDEDERKHFENIRDIFESGFSRYYSYATEPFSEEVSQDECEFVVDVLDLYSTLYYSWLRNPQAHEEIDEKKVLFKGFDLNDNQEIKYLVFYEFLVEKLERYSEIKDLMNAGKIESFNSHGFGPSMSTLSRMIEKYKEIKKRQGFRVGIDLTLDEIKEILE